MLRIILILDLLDRADGAVQQTNSNPPNLTIETLNPNFDTAAATGQP